ncbi:hypothetical protein H5S09_01385 [Limosilactobacillus sp. STM2_1]|uniref:YCII-related domain-containing protein n=1 Tax=Limosilactobacillus rudii TaxID=2759755 RepID=A0A7W3UKE3_9LACO|nr:YciI family protein [Limosilactobacillus rudii]MBB1078495.1 hypothetical protein [Limosilactobacillus rudii]MBB1096625.1 hypothetical protein [Limosilactobacillus rudii]MCD7134180.1 YciI family protein [Limosilactobacillus rudii]
MYLINIKINPKTKINDEKMAAHRQWFKQQFDAGKFLIVGPSKSVPASGIIIAKADSRAELDQLLAKDTFYPGEATYDVNEFAAKLVSNKIESEH